MEKRKKDIDQLLPLNKYGCYFRLVEVEDAEFILSLRKNEKLSRFISPTSNKILDQINWIRDYKKRELKGEEYYIICLSGNQKIKLGLNRLYNFKGNEFEIGSWLFSPDKKSESAVLGDLFSRTMAFEFLNFDLCKFEVRKNNKSVLRYHRFFKPDLIGEDKMNYYFEIDFIRFKKQKDKLLKIFNYD